jgi:phage gp46-like protein
MPHLAHFTDFAVAQDSEGIFDILINEYPSDPKCADFEVTEGEESAFLVSLFSDRRAYPDEVADAMKRRGWIGDLVAEVLNDRHGSGLWLYEQRRLTPEVSTGIRIEAEHALTWMVEQGLFTSVAAVVAVDPVTRTLRLDITGTVSQGTIFSVGYSLANVTRTGLLARV